MVPWDFGSIPTPFNIDCIIKEQWDQFGQNIYWWWDWSSPMYIGSILNQSYLQKILKAGLWPWFGDLGGTYIASLFCLHVIQLGVMLGSFKAISCSVVCHDHMM